MTKDQIVEQWLSIPSNRAQLPIVEYEYKVYSWICTNMENWYFGADDLPVYNVGGSLQIVVSKKTASN